MANEELTKRGLLPGGKLKGARFGEFEELNIGGTSVKELVAARLQLVLPDRVNFPFAHYKPPTHPGRAQPDRVFIRRVQGKLWPVAVAEDKRPGKALSQKALLKAAEQAVFAAAAVGVKVAVVFSGGTSLYVDVEKSLADQVVRYFPETRDFGPGVLANLLAGDAGKAKDPAPLAEAVWQMIWTATKEEPKQCLLTFVEIFVLKFLSDNLPQSVLPDAYRFYGLLADPKDFHNQHGMTAIEYYSNRIRPFIKTLFPDNTVSQDPVVAQVFGLNTLVSKTSVINGFAFLKTSTVALSGFNRTFVDILDAFNAFGPLTRIDPEFKLRLYETFLRRSARQQKLGQFFTPRTVVRSMVRMARLDTLPAGAVVLDPAAGVGGFVLEPQLLVPQCSNNATFAKGAVVRRIKFIGVDVDANTHILAKANTLLHFAEAVRDPSITMPALNQLMAETFVLMNGNETLGALANPPRGTVDVILTNPPYVTRGSGVYKDELKVAGVNDNGVDLRDYYDGCGLGVESFFLRYVTGALKPGGRAFVIVPLGLLNRTNPGPKKQLLEECNVLASVALPRNTFFNTAQLTYILAVEKRHTAADPRPDVFCGIARTIGETLNWERVPTPSDNDLLELAEQFILFSQGDVSRMNGSLISRVSKPGDFGENDRWDVNRFWSEDDLVKLGQRETAVTRLEFIDDTRSELQDISDELEAARSEIQALSSGPTKAVSLSDESYFSVRSGTRITGKEIRENPGSLPVYSCFKSERETKGNVDEKYYTRVKKGTVENDPLVTVNANGASVGKVYVRRERCALTDDVIAIDVKQPGVDLDYLAVALRTAVYKGGFLYEAKLFTTRVKELAVDIPITDTGALDVGQQRAIASAIKRFDSLRSRIHELGLRSENAHAI